MKLAILFSGGKDSNFAMYLASKEHEITCLISLISENNESYMFQTPGNNFLDLQAKTLNLPLIKVKTKGEKESELKDLKKAINIAIKKYNIEGVVSGAIKSNYQSLRIQKICNDLKIWSINPVWQTNEKEYLNKLLENKFEIMIIGVASYPFDKNTLGKIIDEKTKEELISISDKYKISPVGEGGEFESFVLNSPLFKQKLNIIKSQKIMESENCGHIEFKEIKLENKKKEFSFNFELSYSKWYTIEKNFKLNFSKTNQNIQNILIIDTSYEKNSLFKNEFCFPIANIIKEIPNINFEIKHYSEKINFENYDKIIISGSALKDFEYLNHIDKFKFLKTINKPILGICAGMQIIAKIYGTELKKCKEIEITKTITTKENKLFSGVFDTYSIHNYSIESPKEFEILAKSKKGIHAIKHKNKEIYGVLFHPEIKNKELIENFIKQI